jgi:hypothetical protein
MTNINSALVSCPHRMNAMAYTCEHDEEAASFITNFTTNYVTIKCSA